MVGIGNGRKDRIVGRRARYELLEGLLVSNLKANELVLGDSVLSLLVSMSMRD